MSTRGFVVGPIGVRWSRRRALLVVALALLTTAGIVWSLTTGEIQLEVSRVWAGLTGNGTRIEQLITERRLGRALGAVVVGFALGLSGAITQSITRNPIASPDILGVTTGASLFAVAVLTIAGLRAGFDGTSFALAGPAALLGAIVTTALVLALSWRGGFDGFRLVLVGIGVNALALAGISWMLLRTDLETAAVATRWLTGSLDGTRLDDLTLAAPVVLLCALLCLPLAPSLAALRLGDETAACLLGHAPGRAQLRQLAVAVTAAATAVAVAGPIGFVAFVAPQASLRIFRTSGPTPLTAGLVGAALVLAADLAAQALPVSLPVGVVTAIIGAPALLLLLIRHTRRTSV